MKLVGLQLPWSCIFDEAVIQTDPWQSISPTGQVGQNMGRRRALTGRFLILDYRYSQNSFYIRIDLRDMPSAPPISRSGTGAEILRGNTEQPITSSTSRSPFS